MLNVVFPIQSGMSHIPILHRWRETIQCRGMEPENIIGEPYASNNLSGVLANYSVQSVSLKITPYTLESDNGSFILNHYLCVR